MSAIANIRRLATLLHLGIFVKDIDVFQVVETSQLFTGFQLQ
jgi:hypothetical protein